MFYILNVCCVYSLELPHRGDSNEYTQYIYKIKEENLPKLSVYRIWRKSLWTQESVRLIHGKRAIGIRATEVLLYFDNRKTQSLFFCLNNLSCVYVYIMYQIFQNLTVNIGLYKTFYSLHL